MRRLCGRGSSSGRVLDGVDESGLSGCKRGGGQTLYPCSVVMNRNLTACEDIDES